MKIENNSVQGTLMIPLYYKARAMKEYPEVFGDNDCNAVMKEVDYDFSSLEKEASGIKGKIGMLSASIRQYSVVQEIKEYLKEHPKAAVVSLGCGLDMAGHQADTGQCRFFNIDFPPVIDVREEIVPKKKGREINIACDLKDYSWMERIDADKDNGTVFFATGVFLYFAKDEVIKLLRTLAVRYPKGRIIFDAQNLKGANVDRKAIEEAGIAADAIFALEKPVEKTLLSWSDKFECVQNKGLMGAHMDVSQFGFIFKVMAKYADNNGMSQLNIIDFK